MDISRTLKKPGAHPWRRALRGFSLLLCCLIGLGVELRAASPTFVTHEYRYRMAEAGEVFFVWGIYGWHPIPEDLRPPGTFLKDSRMYSRMEREGEYFVRRVSVPFRGRVDCGFLITRNREGEEIEPVWDGDHKFFFVREGKTEVATDRTLRQIAASRLAEELEPLRTPTRKVAMVGLTVLALGLVILRRVRLVRPG